MNHYRIVYFLFIGLFGLAPFSRAQKVVLEKVNVVDLEAGTILKNQYVLIENGDISSVSSTPLRNMERETQVINGTGRFLMPGLIDAHIHFFQSGGLYTRPDVVDLRAERPYLEERQWLNDQASEILKTYLACGITGVVDVGGPMSNYRIREQFKNTPQAPGIWVTGPLISTVQPAEFGEEDPPILKINSAEAARAAVRKQVAFEPDFIKIWYIVGNADRAADHYSMVKACIDEAHQNDLPVAVHATELATAKLALQAGADFLVHSVDDALVDDAFIELLSTRDVSYIPTLSVGTNYLRSFTGTHEFTTQDFKQGLARPLGDLMDVEHLDYPGLRRYQNAADRLETLFDHQDEIARNNLLTLQKAGVNIVTGTDAGNIGTLHGTSYLKELELMSQAGLSNLEVLRASTINAARLLKQDQNIGLVKNGFTADLLLLAGNPLEDLNHILQLDLLINKGKLIDPDTLLRNSPEKLAQQQLNAYNARNLEAFLAPYSEEVEVYRFPDQLLYKGKTKMRTAYEQRFKNSPDLHCELVNRVVFGNTVIDQESVRIKKGEPFLEAIAIYKIEEGKIAQVFFISKE